MNWTKIKNIMILVLVVINLFLIADIGVTQYSSKALPKGTGESFVSVLEKNGITMDEDLIPQYYEKRENIKIGLFNIDSLTKHFIGKQVKYVSDGQNVIASADDKRLVLSGKKFSFSTLHETVEKDGKDIISALKKLGFNTEYMKYVPEEGVVKLAVNSIVVDGIYMDVELSENGEVSRAEGIWADVNVSASDKKVSVISSLGDIIQKVPSGKHITDIEKIYVNSSVKGSIEAVPAWKIYFGDESIVVN